MTQANKPFDKYEKLLKDVEVAEILNISRAMAYELMRQGKIQTVHIGCARRVRPVDLQEFIAKNLSQLLIGDSQIDEVR